MQKKSERSGTLAREIAAHIKEQVVEGTLKPGERLVEAQMSRELGTSRAPIREAARLLESEGLLSFDPNKGFSVRQITLRELIEVYDVAVAVERHAAAKAAEHRNPKLIDALRKQVERIAQAIKAGDQTTYVNADLAFHQMIVEATNNRRLIRIYSEVNVELRLILRLVGEAEHDWQQIAESHLPVIDAIMEGTPLDAANQIEAHIRRFWDDVVRQIHETSTIPLEPMALRSRH